MEEQVFSEGLEGFAGINEALYLYLKSKNTSTSLDVYGETIHNISDTVKLSIRSNGK